MNKFCTITIKNEDINSREIIMWGEYNDYLLYERTLMSGQSNTHLIFNPGIQTLGDRFFTADIKTVYLTNALDQFEYTGMSADVIEKYWITAYKSIEILHETWVYRQTIKGMYGILKGAMSCMGWCKRFFWKKVIDKNTWSI